MSATFASDDWTASFATRLQDSAPVRTEAMSWVYGPILLALDADAESGFEATTLRLDVHEGSVRGVQRLAAGERALAPFTIGGTLARWKAVFGGQLSLVDGVLESKLRVRGDLPTLTRHRALLDGIATAAGELETAWPEPAGEAAAAGAR